ncbi:MAG: hypothetical protein OXC69_10565, partial [Candidatus Tectomicrobia bacterium]|nr:hypothetical protein [Candidatus Tectomicrobia bacterium]
MPQKIVIAHEEHESGTQKQAEQDPENYTPVKFGSGFAHAWSMALADSGLPFRQAQHPLPDDVPL